MSLRRSRLSASEIRKLRRENRQRNRRRRPQLETLEVRQLLAVGPQLLSISADGGRPLADGQLLNVAPRELTFRFEDTSPINPETVDAIKLTRSVNEVFGDSDDESIQPGSIGIGSTPTTVVARFSRPLVDDTYRITIVGSGSNPLANSAGEPFNAGVDITQQLELDLGPQIIAIVPQPIDRDPVTGVLSQALNQVVVHFNGDSLNRLSAESNDFYRLINQDDGSLSLPAIARYNAADDQVVLTFASALPEANYRLEIGDSSESNDELATAVNLGAVGAGFHTSSFLGETSAGADDVDLYRIHALDAGALVATATPGGVLNTAVRLFDESGAEVSSANPGSAGEPDVLSFAVPAAGTYFIGVSSNANNAYDPVDGSGVVDGDSGVYTLDVTFDLTLSVDDDNSTFATATDVGVLGSAGRELSEAISASPISFPLPGGVDGPGHREIPGEAHLGGGAPTPSGPLRIAFYNFQGEYGSDPVGNPLVNGITDNQKQLSREIFEIYGDLLGLQFVESPSLGLTVVTGDLRAVDPSVSTGPGGVAGISDGTLTGTVVMDAAENWQSSQRGGSWFQVAMHEIGHSLGAGHSYDLPGLTIMGDRASIDSSRFPNENEPVFPGDNDIIHFQRLHPPRANDLDLYRFEIIETGQLRVETVAERILPSASLLDTKITLYRDGDAARQYISSNDDYFGKDSYLELDLEPGVYYLGVSSTGLEEVDPAIPDSGFGGTTEGAYDLRFEFSAGSQSNLRDATGASLDGDADGVAGGNYEFWFQAGRTIVVDKANDTTGGDDGSGTLFDPFDSIPSALAAAANRINIPSGGGTLFADGQFFTVFDGMKQVTFELDSGLGVAPGNEAVPFVAADTADVIAAALATAISGVAGFDATATATGSTVELSGVAQADLSGVPALLYVPNIVRVVGNGGADGDLSTATDNLPYQVGLDELDAALVDGEQLLVPQGVTFMVDAGVQFKLQRANVDVGTSSLGISRSHGAIQLLGIPELPIYFRHFRDDSIGGDSDGPSEGAESGGWGGIVFRDDSDLEEIGVFLNYVNHTDISHGGGQVFVDGDDVSFTPIHLLAARPTLSHNTITSSAGAAVSAGLDSFDDSLGRFGPDIHDNNIFNNSINGLFVRINTDFGQSLDRLEGNARWDDFDITHVLTETLQIAGNPGGPMLGPSGEFIARPAGRLRIDPGVVVKSEGARIEAEIGAQLVAEGTADRKIIFTSQKDDSFGGSGSFDTSNDGDANPAMPGQWGGLFFNPRSRGNLDHVVIAHGGGLTPIEGGFDGFDAIEIHQAEVRVTRSELRDNSSTGGRGDRNGRGTSERATVFIRGAQPTIVDNVFANNTGDVINANASALQFQVTTDPGRSTGASERYPEFDDNHGPLIRMNRLANNGINGLVVRGGTLTTRSVWDDTDIVHVLEDEIIVPDHHTYSGLILQSSNSASLVIKLEGDDAGFTASGNPLDIQDRIGGTIQIVGTGSHPVVFTALEDDTITAGLDPEGRLQGDTNNNGPVAPLAGDWRSVRLDRFSNDRNVRFIRETEPSFAGQQDINATPAQARVLGVLAPDEKSGDGNRSFGFKVSGFISLDSPSDVDVYSFTGTAGSEVWIDIDRTSPALNAMVELVNASGRVVARSTDNDTLSGIAEHIIKDITSGGDFYTVNALDPAMRVTLPGVSGSTNNYFVRVRSEPAAGDIETISGGLSRGEYELQIRLRQVDEIPGSTIRFADIHYATNGIEVLGLPSHSPLTGDSYEVGTGITDIGNLLASDRGSLSVGGNLSDQDNVDLYRFSVDFDLIQAISGFNAGGKTFPAVFDIDYADALSRPDTTVALFDEATGELLLISRDSNVIDDQPAAGQGADVDDLERGSFGKLDSFLGSVQLPAGAVPAGSTRSYILAVMSNAQLPVALDASFDIAGNSLIRLEPISGISRIAEDHIGFQGYTSGNADLGTVNVAPQTQLFDISSSIALSANAIPLTLADMVLFVSSPNRLMAVEPFTGQVSSDIGPLALGSMGMQGAAAPSVRDIVMRSDGVLWAAESLPLGQGTAGSISIVDPSTGVQGNRMNDAIPDFMPGPPPLGIDSDFVDALTWRRSGFDTVLNEVEYDLYYSVRDDVNGGSVLYRADPDTGSAAIVGGPPPLPWGPQGPIVITGMESALTTGLAFSGNTMYGVNDRGLFYRILQFTGVPFHPETGAPFQGKAVLGAEDGFIGMAPGPESLQGGAFADLLFAMTSSGRLFALDTTGEPQAVFVGGATFVETGLSGLTGLAFGPVDFNLWHPTMRRRDDPGHGINPAFDGSRSGGGRAELVINGYQSNEAEGGASFYFGFEPWLEIDALAEYIRYDGNVQFGLTEQQHRDLTTNPGITGSGGGNNYNLPGGAQGSLVTRPVDLSAYAAADKPTVYFTYYLETEDSNSIGTGPGCCMRDSARIFGSMDAGDTWVLLATNNSVLRSGPMAELGPAPSISGVQELFDNSGGWRQARLDISQFAGADSVLVRFDFATAGSFNQDLPGDANGSFFEKERFLLNEFEGFYIDDLIIGFSERGEMATNPPLNTMGTFAVPVNSAPGGANQVLVGDYQLEIRLGTPTAVNQTGTVDDIIIVSPLDTNDRLIPELGRVGDRNVRREQGHIQIESNRVEDVAGFGIVVDAGDRGISGNRPSPPPIRNLPTANNSRLVPGITIENNLIVSAAAGGIRYRGDLNSGNSSVASVPFGRILNNTVYESAVGIEVAQNASPTILNNIVANSSTGISVDGTSLSTVVGANLFSGNAEDGTLGENSIVQSEEEPLFIDPDSGNFYLAPGSKAIDSSMNSLIDRPEMVAVGSPLGIPPSPIVVPDRDFFGQLRVDDPSQEPPPGLGSNIFKDRGAIERADFVGPSGLVIAPLDQGAGDLDPDPTIVRVDDPILSEILILVSDVGLGIDLASVTSDRVTLEMDGLLLVEGVDYEFGFDQTNSTIRLTELPNNGSFRERYDVTLDNSQATGIRDLADTVVRPNRPGGVTAFTIFTAGLNKAPTLVDDEEITGENLPVTIAVLSNDVGPDSPIVVDTLVITADPANGTVVVNADGTIVYSPETDFTGTDSFRYTVEDLDGDVSNEATVTVSVVTDVNDAPMLDVSSSMSLSNINEDDGNSPGNTVTEIIRSVPGDAITDIDIGAVEGIAVIGADTSNGQWEYNIGSGWMQLGAVSDISATLLDVTAHIRFVPNADYSGASGNLTLRAWDQSTGSNGEMDVDASVNGGRTAFSLDTALASLNVIPVNDPPRPRDDDNTDPGGLTTNEDTPFTFSGSLLLANDQDDTLGSVLEIVSINQSATLGLVQLRQSVVGTTITYFPNGAFESLTPGQTATDTFTYTIGEVAGLVGTATVAITITGVNDAPVAGDDLFSGDEDSVLSVPAGSLLVNDADPEGDTLVTVAATVTSSLGAAVTIRPDGSFDYDPAPSALIQDLAPGVTRPDTFIYRVTDGAEEADGTVTVNISGLNDPPMAVDDSYTMTEDGTLEVSTIDGVLANDSDSEGDPIASRIEQQPANGTLSLSTDGAFSYVPNANFFGTDTFTYSVSDGISSSIGTVEIEVLNANDAPNPTDDLYEVEQDEVLDVSAANGVLSNDSDPDLEPLSAERLSGPSSGGLTLNSDGSFTYIPTPGFFGRDVFIYRAIDGRGASSTATVTIDVSNTRPWRNPSNPLDVSGDGSVSPNDVLLIINFINDQGSGPVPVPTPDPPPFRDVNGDNFVSAADALAIINFLNSGAGQPEGEGEGASSLRIPTRLLDADNAQLANEDGTPSGQSIELIDTAFADGVLNGPVKSSTDATRNPPADLDDQLVDDLAQHLSDDDELDTLFGRLA
jgi:VCBS repeat-containing protein